jgi:amino acid adenylation domain-containing protein
VGRVLDAVLADPDAPVDRIDLLTPAERAELIAASGAPDGEADAAAWTAPFAPDGAPDAVAVVCESERLTYRELDGRCGGLAAALAGAGARTGDRIGVCLQRGVGAIAAMVGVWRAGGVYVPLDIQLPTERLRTMLADAGVQLILADAATAPALAGLDVPVLRADLADDDPDGPRHAAGPDEPAYVIFTSGSTGRPKPVCGGHGALAGHVKAARRLFRLTPHDRVLTFASISFDASLEQILPALSAGARVVVRPDVIWSVEQLADRIREHGVTVMELTPSYWVQLAAQVDALAPQLASLRMLVTGGEVLPAAPLEQWFAALPGSEVVNTYGPTETGISATARVVDGPVAGRVPIGRPLGGRRGYVCDPHGALVPSGFPGELLISGPELAQGYMGAPALTAERFLPDPYGQAGGRLYRTGDRVRRLPDGELDFIGRTDSQVKIRGFRVEPGEIETVLRRHPGVHAAAVLVRVVHGESALIGYVAADGLTAEELAAHCRAHLPGYMVPSAFAVLASLPVTVQGKLDAAALPEPDFETVAYVAPRTPTQTVIAQIWAEVLGAVRVGLHDDFFALGGHSLRAVAAASRLRAAFDCPVVVRDLFEHPTVELLAAEVERQLIELISAMSQDEIELSLTGDLVD